MNVIRFSSVPVTASVQCISKGERRAGGNTVTLVYHHDMGARWT